MRSKQILVFILVLLAAICFAEEKPVGYQVTELAKNLYKLTVDGGGYDVKVLAFVGDDGMLLVETGTKDYAENLKEVLHTLYPDEPAYIINSHQHVEHIGGNYIFDEKVIFIGYENLRTTLTSGANLFSEYPDELLPEMTFSEPITLYFNNEVINLIPVIDSHTDNDVIVWFTKSKVAYVGAVSNGNHFPSVDETGDVMKYKDNVQQLLDILPEDTQIIPGHGADGSMEDLRAFLNMLIDTEALVKQGLDDGKDLETMQEEDLLKGYESFESYTNKSLWIQYLQEAFQVKTELKEPIFEKLYLAMKAGGIDAAIEKYYELKEHQSDKYRFQEYDLFRIGYKLYDAEKYQESIDIFEMNIKEFPENNYNWLSYYNIGSAYEELKDVENAKMSYEKSLELKPVNSYAKKALEELVEKE
ncbi:MAG: MBL fold metallo-hydrolase [Armatimonadetes bacterium]|nr:MBL fold metallo-hydrolase [Armatimonadota bacterium]